MSVYVDPLRATIPSPKWPFSTGCHLFADRMAELQELAGRLGLAPVWLHPVRGFAHYDLTGGKRADAVRLGAVEVGREFVAGWRDANTKLKPKTVKGRK